MMIYFKRRVSSFGDSLKVTLLLYAAKQPQLTKHIIFYADKDLGRIQKSKVAFNATKDGDDLLQKKSVIFSWLTEVILSLHPAK